MTRRTIIVNCIVAAVLLGLLALTALLASLDLGPLGTTIGLGIAAVKVLLIAIVFMELHERDALARVFAVAGVYWLAILMVLTVADVLARA